MKAQPKVKIFALTKAGKLFKLDRSLLTLKETNLIICDYADCGNLNILSLSDENATNFYHAISGLIQCYNCAHEKEQINITFSDLSLKNSRTSELC